MDIMKGAMSNRKSRYHIEIAVLIPILTSILTSVVSLPLLSPDGNISVTVNSSFTMECSYTGLVNQQDSYLINWLQGTTFQGNVNTNCTLKGKLNTGYYTVVCPTQNQQSITINRVDLTLHDTIWKCELVVIGSFGSIISTNAVTIIVNVPVTSVILTNQTSATRDVFEGVPMPFVCKTSPCRPAATVLWYKSGPNSKIEQLNGTISLTYDTTDNSLSVTTSTLSYSASRTDTGYNIYCTAINDDVPTGISSVQQQINVLYAPDSRPAIQDYGGKNYSLIENSTLVLKCSITEANPRPILTWTCNGGTTANMSYGSDTTLRLTWKAERGKDGPCTCTSYHPVVPNNLSDVVNVVVLYPPSTPVILLNGTPTTGTVKIVINTTVPLNCSSSSNPPSTYTWQYRESQLNARSVSLKVVANGEATCTATNNITVTTGETKMYSSNKVMMLNSLYGPTQTNISCLSGNTHQLIDNNSVNVINGDSLTLICSSNGDPQPEYTWNVQRNGNETITITILQDNLIYNCTASNVLEPDYGSNKNMMDSKKVRIIRQYAPEMKPTITYAEGQLPGKLISSLSVVENSSFVLTCENSYSVPPPMYQWSGEMNSTTGHLNVKSIKRSSFVDYNGTSYYEYTCKVHNIMTNTCGDKRTQIGTLEFKQRVNVLFTTELGTVPDQSILAGEHLTLTATLIAPGSPRGTYKWLYRKAETSNITEIADSLSHTLHNISRGQAGFYTIEATNRLAPTDQMSYTTSVNQTLYLNVFYTSTVSLFTINEQEGSCTVHENTTVSFVCGVDSNPLSVVYIHATTYNGESRLTELLTTKKVEHTLQIATCYDSGLYRCIGQNNYTSKPVSWDNRLLVRCTPRPRYDVGQNITFHKALGASVTLNLTLIAYPEPAAQRFNWGKVNGENITELINSTHMQIITTGLATNLTIDSLNQTEFGQYRLLVNYTYIHYFYISPQDEPQIPTHFTHVEEHLTETTAILKWRPGFDGGLPQTFYILYKKQSESTWSHTHAPGSNVTLSNLVPGTFYYVKMFASNSLGNSSETDVLNITTHERTKESSSLPIAAIAVASGCAAALIVIVIVVKFVVLRRNRRKGRKTDQCRKTLCNDGPVYDADGMERNMAYESAQSLGLQQPSTSSDVYAHVDKSMSPLNNVGENTYAVVDKSRKTEIVPTGDSDVYAMPIKKKADKKAKKGKKGRGGNKKGQNVYENAHELNAYKTAVQTKETSEENIYETGEGNTMPKRNVNKDGLLYADLAFDNNNKGQKKLVIRGLENATDYVEVDFSKKAEPLPESDGEGDIA